MIVCAGAAPLEKIAAERAAASSKRDVLMISPMLSRLARQVAVIPAKKEYRDL
jgi:hypothetical protein